VTILCAETLVNFLDLIAEGASTVEASSAIGCAPKSKIVFSWLNDSEAASEFGSPPDESSPWCVMWNEKLDWLHFHYRTAKEHGRETRALRVPPIRADLEEKLADLKTRRAAEGKSISRTSENRPARIPMVPVMLPDPPAPPASYPSAPPPRPSYAFVRAPRLDGEDREFGPPPAGRFTMATKSYSQEERQAGLPEITETGIRYH
jgi:hypothetical protein